MIMSEKLYQNPIPEWNAAWFIRGKNPMYTHVKKSSELSFSPVYNETTVTNGFMDRTYIEKKFLDRFTFSEFCKHITSIYIFRIFTK